MKRIIIIALLVLAVMTGALAQQFDLTSVKSENKIAQSPFFTISNNAMNLYANQNFSSPFAIATGDTFVVEQQSSSSPSTLTSVANDKFNLKNFRLEQNYPNPFNMSTIVRYSIPEEAEVTIKVFDISGREIGTLVNTKQAAGTHSVGFGKTDIASGTYFYRMVARTSDGNTNVETKKMIVMK